MAYSIKCADAGMDCPGSFTTETKEELMKHVEMHASEAHPDLDLQPEQVEALVELRLSSAPQRAHEDAAVLAAESVHGAG